MLLVVGASGLAREALAVPGVADAYEHVAVLDDDPRRWGSELGGHSVLVGGIERIAEFRSAQVLVAVGSGRARRAIVARLRDLRVTHHRFATIRHPSVALPPGCTVGAGSILLAHVSLTCDVRVGAHVVAMPGVTLTHDVTVDEHATLCAGVSLGGGVAVGSGAYLGMNAAVREGVRVGRDAVLGAGAVLLTDLPDGETWAGVPARPLRVPVAAGL